MWKKACVSAVFVGLSMPVHAEFLGVFTLESVPLSNCEVLRLGTLITYSRYGLGKSGGGKGFGNLDTLATNATDALESLGATAEELGYDAILGARLTISHAMDAVYESGQNWTNGGDSFDFDGGFVAVAYGTPVTLDCS